VVIIHDSELLGQSNDATGTAGSQLGAEALKQVLSSGSAAGGRGTTNITAEKLGSEFLIVDSTAGVGIVALKESIQILSENLHKIEKAIPT
jgi:hypothetical protein